MISVDQTVLETLMSKVAAIEAKNSEIEAKHNALAAKLAILTGATSNESSKEPPESVTSHPLWIAVNAATNRNRLQQFMEYNLGDRVTGHFAIIETIERLIPTRWRYCDVDGNSVGQMTIDYAGFQRPTGTRRELLSQIDTLWITNPRKAIYIACDLISGRATDYANFNSGLFTELHPQPCAVKIFSDIIKEASGASLTAYKWIWSPNAVQHMENYYNEQEREQQILRKKAYAEPRYVSATNVNKPSMSKTLSEDTKYGTLGICGMVQYSDAFPTIDHSLPFARQKTTRSNTLPEPYVAACDYTPQTETMGPEQMAAWRAAYGITDENVLIRAHT
jgi:hypothetical protein